MRASLRHHLGRELRRGRLLKLGRIGLRALAARHDLDLPATLSGPLLTTLAITYRCPLGCQMCSLPARARREMDDAEVLRWVDAIADLSSAGLGFTGGEPLLRSVVEEAIERAARRGIVTHLNTSGLPLSAERATRLVASGLASVNVSIDHDDSHSHDSLRRCPGSHGKALRAISLLAKARQLAGSPMRIQVVMAVSRNTLDRVRPLRDQVVAAGADALSLLPVHSFSRIPPTSEPSMPPVDLERLCLENSREYLRGIVPFLDGAKTSTSCSAPRTGLFIDPRGHLFACTPAASASDGGIPATPESLGEVLLGHDLSKTVPAGSCERCWWNCHRELDIAIGSPVKTGMPARSP